MEPSTRLGGSPAYRHTYHFVCRRKVSFQPRSFYVFILPFFLRGWLDIGVFYLIPVPIFLGDEAMGPDGR